jgi:hypothetical protein
MLLRLASSAPGTWLPLRHFKGDVVAVVVPVVDFKAVAVAAGVRLFLFVMILVTNHIPLTGVIYLHSRKQTDRAGKRRRSFSRSKGPSARIIEVTSIRLQLMFYMYFIVALVFPFPCSLAAYVDYSSGENIDAFLASLHDMSSEVY